MVIYIRRELERIRRRKARAGMCTQMPPIAGTHQTAY